MVAAPNEGFSEIHFIKPAHITTKFETVVILGEVFKIKMVEDVSYICHPFLTRPGRHNPPLSPSPRPPVSLSHKNYGDKTTVWQIDCLLAHVANRTDKCLTEVYPLTPLSECLCKIFATVEQI